MTAYVALLRCIMPTNPNMRNEKLRGVFESLGFKNVATVIASGNVVFETNSKNTKALEAKIEKALPAQLGFTSTTIIRSREALQQLVDQNPFKDLQDTPKSRLNVTFLKNAPNITFTFPYIAKDKSYKLIALDARTIGSIIDLSGAGSPDVMLWLEKQFGKQITTRTWRTVHRILEKMRKIS
jgi:uncharacterized protein (DUF1697 family)